MYVSYVCTRSTEGVSTPGSKSRPAQGLADHVGSFLCGEQAQQNQKGNWNQEPWGYLRIMWRHFINKALRRQILVWTSPSWKTIPGGTVWELQNHLWFHHWIMFHQNSHCSAFSTEIWTSRFRQLNLDVRVFVNAHKVSYLLFSCCSRRGWINCRSCVSLTQVFWIPLDSHLKRHQSHTSGHWPVPKPLDATQAALWCYVQCGWIPQETLLLLQHLPPQGFVCARTAASVFISKLPLQSLCFFLPSHRCLILTAQRAVDQALSNSAGAFANKEIVMPVRFLWVERSHLQPPMKWHDKLFISAFLSFSVYIQNMNVL